MIENRNPEVLARMSRMEQLGNPKEGHIFELNAGPFGGDDGEQYMQAYQKTVEEFSRRLNQINSPNYERFNNFLKLLEQAETEGEAKNLMSENMTRKAETIIKNARANISKIIVIAVVDEVYLNENEEDAKLQKRITELCPEIPCVLVPVSKLLQSVQIGTFRNLEYPNIKATKYDIFLYNDFTGPELSNFCEENKYNFDKVLGTIKGFKKLDPLDIEDKTDRDFIEKLKLDYEYFKLLNPPLQKNDLSIVDGKIVLAKDGKELDLDNLILKRKGTFGGAVKYFKQEDEKKRLTDNPDLLFDKQEIIEMITNENRNVFDIDTRISYEYDPKTKNLRKIGLYGRFNVLGEPNNIARGAGVIGIKVIKNEMYSEIKLKMLELTTSLSPEEARWFHERMTENLKECGFEEKGKVIPFSTLPHLMTETSLDEIDRTALEIAQKMVEARDDEFKQDPFIFAVDASINPNL